MRPLVIAGAVVGLAMGCGAGCAKSGPSTQRLGAQSFTDRQASVSNGGAGNLNQSRPIVQEIVAAPSTQSTTQSTTRPAIAAAAPSGVSLGTYMTIGTVVAEANGQPIYADKVLAKVDPALSAQARNLDEAAFKRVAAVLIRDQIDNDIYEELEFAAADRAATDEERQHASGITTRWRQQEIIKAGGSEAVARRRWLEGPEAVDFDEKVQEQYRRFLVVLHYQKRIFPLVSLTADEMRAYYDQNFETLFNAKAAVRFRLIKVDVARRGGAARAMELAQDLQTRAARGDSFVELSRVTNDDPMLRRTGGYVLTEEVKKEDGTTLTVPRWIPRGTLGGKLETVEKAVFELNKPGDVTPVIDTGDALYIARLEEKQGGSAQAFDDPIVQAKIRDSLMTEQRKKLRDKERQKLLQTAVHRKDEKGLAIAVDMAMQKYGVFVRGNAFRDDK